MSGGHTSPHNPFESNQLSQNPMHLNSSLIKLALLVLLPAILHAAPVGTSFTFQGRLPNDAPANATVPMTFSLWDAATGGGNVGNPASLPLNVTVANRVFSVDLDFGTAAFTGDARWLQTTRNGVVDPQRIRVAPTPNAIFASTAGAVKAGAISTAQISDGAITGPKLGQGSIATGNIAENAITGAKIASGQVVRSISVNGSGNLRDVVNLAAGNNVTLTPSGDTVTISAPGGGGSGPWQTLNNNAYYNAGRIGIGTSTPSFPLHLSSTAAASGVLEALLQPNLANGGFNQIYLGRTAAGNSCGTFTYSYNASTPANSLLSLGLYDSSFSLNVLGNGNVGIGTTTANRHLVVSGLGFDGGGARFESLNHANSITISGVDGPGINDTAFLLLHDQTGPSLGAFVGLTGTAAGFSGDLRFGTALTERMRIKHNGNVGIGTDNPAVKLDVYSAESTAIVGASGSADVPAAIIGVNHVNNTGILGESRGSGVGVYGKSATGEGVHGESSSSLAAVVGVNLAGGAGVYGESRGGGYAGHFAGRTRVCTLEIYGGCDLAEPFPMKEDQIEKGSVVVIDDEHPGRLKLSTRAYDTQVAGIVSGANGISPGIALKQEGLVDQGQNVALTGRVYVKADASLGAIKPGDLLTTSDTPGHAMKVSDHGKSQGAILGKAMSALQGGTGLVLVLVTLQ